MISPVVVVDVSARAFMGSVTEALTAHAAPVAATVAMKLRRDIVSCAMDSPFLPLSPRFRWWRIGVSIAVRNPSSRPPRNRSARRRCAFLQRTRRVHGALNRVAIICLEAGWETMAARHHRHLMIFKGMPGQKAVYEVLRMLAGRVRRVCVVESVPRPRGTGARRRKGRLRASEGDS